jgi:hypothetical protein
MGLWYSNVGSLPGSGDLFQKSHRYTHRTKPKSDQWGASFNLGLAMRLQGEDTEAYDAFYKSVWNDAFMDNRLFPIGTT